MDRLYKIAVLVIFIIGGTLFLFNNFVTKYNEEIQKTQHKKEGVEFAQQIQRFILKLQKLRGYAQFEELSLSEQKWSIVKNNTELIKSDVKKDMQNIKNGMMFYPSLYDNDYDHLLNEAEVLIQSSEKDGVALYQKYTYIIEQLQEKMYYLGFKSKLLLESESDRYFLVETMLKHVPNFIEIVGKIRAKTTKAIIDRSGDAEVRYSIINSCFACEEHSGFIQRTVNEINNEVEKTRLLGLLDNINSQTKKMKEYVKATVTTSEYSDMDALEFFDMATGVIDKAFGLYSTNAEFLNQKLLLKLEELKRTKLYGIIIGAVIVLFILLTVFSMIRSYILYTRSEKKIKNNLTSIIELKNELEKRKTIGEISSAALYFFAQKFDIVQGAIYLFNEENAKLYLASSYATNDMKPIIELGEGLVGEVAVQKRHIHTNIHNEQKTQFGIESVTLKPTNICTIPLIRQEKIFGVLQLGFLKDVTIVHNDDFAYYIDMIIGFLRDTKHLETTKKYIELIDKHVIISKTNTKGIVSDVSDAFTKISGYSKEEIIGKTQSIVAHPDTPKELYAELWDTILAGRIYKGEIKNLNKNGKEYWVDITITPQTDRYGNILGFSAILHDITDKKRIEQYSITDSLTGLYNRRFFDTNFAKEYNISKREDKNLVLLLIDIDYFKQYNDMYGHQKGDDVLKAIASQMKMFFKRANDYVYRIGGEEFAVSFYGMNQKGTFERAESLRQSIQELKIEHDMPGTSRYVSISVGIFTIPRDRIISLEEVYKITDEALYRAKKNGRNRVEEAVLNP